jgi:hypothetical protein
MRKPKLIVIKTKAKLDEIFEKCDAQKVIGELSKGIAKRIDDEYKNGQQAKKNHHPTRRNLRNRRA